VFLRADLESTDSRGVWRGFLRADVEEEIFREKKARMMKNARK
jgi:hypothetical protein